MLRRMHSFCSRSMIAMSLLVCLLVLSPHAAAQESAQLRYKWTEGQVIRQRMTTESVSEGAGPMGPMKVTQKQVMVMRMTPQAVAEDGTATIEIVYESMRIDSENPIQGKTTFDSTKPNEGDADNPSVQAMAAMLNEPMVMVMSPDGTVKDVSGFEKVLTKMRDSMKDSPGAEMMMPEFEKMYSDEGLKKMLGQATALLPNRDVKVNEGWQRVMDASMPMFGTLQSTMDFTFKGFEQLGDVNAAKVDFVTRIVQLAPRAAPPVPGMKMEMGDASGSGQLWFDTARGLTLKQLQKQTVTMNITIDAGGQQMKMSQKVDTTMTFENIEAGDEGAEAPAKPAEDAAKSPAK